MSSMRMMMIPLPVRLLYLLRLLLAFLLAWVLTGYSTCVAAASEGSPTTPNHQHSLWIPVGDDGLCPNTNVSSVCDPDRLLTQDDLDNIEALILEAYQGSWFACGSKDATAQEQIRVQMGVYIRQHDRPHDKEEVARLRLDWGIGDHTPCGNNGVLLYLTVSETMAHVYLSAGDAMLPALNRMVLQAVEDGMKPFLRHHLYGEAIQEGILDLTAYVRGDKHFADLQEECLRDFYLSSWFFIFILYCCGGRLLLLVMHVYGRRGLELDSRARLHLLRHEVEEKLEEIEEHYKHKTQGHYMSPCCPICFEPFPTKAAAAEPATEETPLVFQKNQVGSDGKALKSLPCGHVFDHSCIVDWMITLRAKNRDARLSCPVCMENF